MPHITIRLHGELNDFVSATRRERPLLVSWSRRSIKDLLESLGVPHPEIAVILANGAPVDLGYLPAPHDAIDVFPWQDDLPAAPQLPPPAPRFVLDTHLGKLAERLRLLGFDTCYRNNYDDSVLAHIAADEGRILLTRDRGLLKRGSVTYGRYVRATESFQQVIEIMRRFDLWDAIAPFRRCIRCNGALQPVVKSAIADQLPPRIRAEYDEFRRCTSCGRIYWAGSHYRRLCQFVERVRAAAGG
jgi:uncharacterized protein with PIN domain/sulfur carrier protein ThiS